MRRILATVALVAFTSLVSDAQQTQSKSITEVTTAPAYCMLVIRKAEVKAELQTILEEDTSEHPSAQLRQFELKAIKHEMDEMAETPASNLSKLTSGYGMLILRKVKLKSEMQALLLEFTPDYPEVKLKEVELNLLKHEIAKIM